MRPSFVTLRAWHVRASLSRAQLSAVARHVAYIEARGPRTPQRLGRQRVILESVARHYRPLPEKPAREDRPFDAFAFSTRTTAAEAISRLVGILDSVDADWRDYVRVWDGWGRDDSSRPLSDPPQRGVLEIVQRLFGR